MTRRMAPPAAPSSRRSLALSLLFVVIVLLAAAAFTLWPHTASIRAPQPAASDGEGTPATPTSMPSARSQVDVLAAGAAPGARGFSARA